MHLQETVKREAVRVSAATAIGCAIMLLVFFLLHIAHIFGNVPFGAAEVISGAIGWAVASLNFFLMAVTVQKVAGETDQDKAKKQMTVSYRYRMILQLVWAVISILVPFFNGAAGIIPLFIPSIAIKLSGVVNRRKTKNSAGGNTGSQHDPNGEVTTSR